MYALHEPHCMAINILNDRKEATLFDIILFHCNVCVFPEIMFLWLLICLHENKKRQRCLISYFVVL